MKYYDIPAKKTFDDLGLDAFGQAPFKFSGSGINLKSKPFYEAGVPSNFIQDGDMIVRLNVIDGYLQSNGFVSGSKGWRLDTDDLEAESGYFRGSIAAATGLFAGTMNWSGVTAGTNTKALNVGNGYVKIDGGNKRIIINDGTNDRILMGYLSGKF